MVNRGWLYGLIVLLAQTCNPYYSANDSRNQYEEDIVFEESEVDEIPEQVFEIEEEEEPKYYIDQTFDEPAEKERVFNVVEDMPRFPGCEDKGLDKKEIKKCSDEELLKFVYSNLSYPKEARKNGIEGRVIMQWVVQTDGSITDINVLREPGGGCGEEAVRVAKLMPTWIPGKQRGKAVPVKFTFPISFKLNNKKRRRN